MISSISLSSSSSGNSYIIKSDETMIMVDVGIATIHYMNAMKKLDYDYKELKGIFITHAHSDHVSGLARLSTKLKVPVFISSKTFLKLKEDDKDRMTNILHFRPEDSIDIGDLKVETIPNEHDCIDPVCFTIKSKTKRIGIFTDFGHVTENIEEAVSDCDAVYMEANYDPGLLESNPKYPHFLKARIKGIHGHISNDESATLVYEYSSDKLKHVILSHLSMGTNDPAIALESYYKVYGKKELPFELSVAPRCTPGELIHLY